MHLEEILGKYLRLQAELQRELSSARPHDALAERLCADVAEAERILTAMQPVDEQTDECLLYVSGGGSPAFGLSPSPETS